MKRALITGISGFVGRALEAHLSAAGVKVFGLDRHGLGEFVFKGSVNERHAVARALEHSQPDAVFHLAGVLKSPEMESFYHVHVLGTATLLDAILESGLKPRVVVASSSAVYGAGLGKRPISESFAPRPATHYAASKLAQETVALRYYHSSGLPVVIARAFNLLGPGLSPQLAPSAFARQIALAELNHKSKTIHTGDLSARRDYLDARDAVRAYDMIARRGTPGQIYNVCSGRAISLEECLQILISRATVKVERAFDPARAQTHDVPVQVGSAKKIRRELGWRARIPLERSLLDLLDDWREKITREEYE